MTRAGLGTAVGGVCGKRVFERSGGLGAGRRCGTRRPWCRTRKCLRSPRRPSGTITLDIDEGRAGTSSTS